MSEPVVRIIADYGTHAQLMFVGYLSRAAQRCGLSKDELLKRISRLGEVRQPSDSTWPKPQRYYAELA